MQNRRFAAADKSDMTDKSHVAVISDTAPIPSKVEMDIFRLSLLLADEHAGNYIYSQDICGYR